MFFSFYVVFRTDYSVLVVYLKSITALNCVLLIPDEKVYCVSSIVSITTVAHQLACSQAHSYCNNALSLQASFQQCLIIVYDSFAQSCNTTMTQNRKCENAKSKSARLLLTTCNCKCYSCDHRTT